MRKIILELRKWQIFEIFLLYFIILIGSFILSLWFSYNIEYKLRELFIINLAFEKDQILITKELGQLLQTMFGERLYRYDHIQMDIGKTIVLLSKKPHLYHVSDQKTILHKTIKLFLSRGQRPTASRILFCDQTTTIEQIECFYMHLLIQNTSIEFLPLLH